MRPWILALALLPSSARAQEAVVNDVAAEVYASSAVVTWASDPPGDGRVEYGRTPAYGLSTPVEPGPSTVHRAELSGLTSGRLYHYRVSSRAPSGAAAASSDYTLTAGAPPLVLVATAPAAPVDRRPPAVVLMTPAQDSSVSQTVAVSANATDDVGVSSVQFLLDGAPLGLPISSSPFAFQWKTTDASDGPHALSAVATDAARNSPTSSVVSLTIDNAAPKLTSVRAEASAPGSALVRWTTNERADERVEYGTTTAYGTSTTLARGAAVDHAVGLTGLLPGAEYHFRVVSRDPAGNAAFSPDGVLTAGAGDGRSRPAAGPAATPGEDARSAQRRITPARADGINDAAVFGPEAAVVTVYDLHGRKVFREASSSAAAPVVWRGRDANGRVLESGVYLVEILKRDGSKARESVVIAK